MPQDNQQRSSQNPVWRYIAVVLGTTFAVEFSIMLILPLTGAIGTEGWVTAVVDATALVLIQAPVFWWLVVRPLRDEVHAAGERYRLLFERSLAGIYRVSVDGRFLNCNPAGAKLLGYASPEELLLSNAAEFTSADQREAFVASVRESRGLVNRESCLTRKDGTSVWVLESATYIDGVATARPPQSKAR